MVGGGPTPVVRVLHVPASVNLVAVAAEILTDSKVGTVDGAVWREVDLQRSVAVMSFGRRDLRDGVTAGGGDIRTEVGPPRGGQSTVAIQQPDQRTP